MLLKESAKIAREAFHVGEAPYFGIPVIAEADFEPGYCPRVVIAFLNGGKTPAWHVHSNPELIVGNMTEDGGISACALLTLRVTPTCKIHSSLLEPRGVSSIKAAFTSQ